MAKSDGMLRILLLLGRGRQVTARELADALEVNLRTVYRYIDSLCASGVPVVAETGPGGGYRLAEAFSGTPLFFTREQLVALFQAASLARAANPPHPEPLAAALDRLRLHLPPAQAALVERHTAGLVVVPDGPGDVQPWLGLLEECVADRVTVDLHYQKPGAPEPEARRVDPHSLVYVGGRWYLHGYCHLRREEREFRVDRVRAVRRTDATFAPPPDAQPAPWHDDTWVHRQVGAEPLTSVCLTGEPRALTSLCEHWYFRHCLVERGETEATLAVDPVGLEYLPPALLYHGEKLRVVSPDRVRCEVAALALRLARHHAGGAGAEGA